MTNKKVKIFYSYSHKDKSLREELEAHLAVFGRQGLVDDWSDEHILAGTNWKENITVKLDEADIILLLISSSYLSSNACFDEMITALDKHQKKIAIVIPIIIRPCAWKEAPFDIKNILALPKDGKAITLWNNRDQAWLNVVEGIYRLIKKHLGTFKHKIKNNTSVETSTDLRHNIEMTEVLNLACGTYYDHSIHDDNRIIIGISNISLNEKGSSINWSGTNYSDKGEFIGSYKADLIKKEWPQLTFRYQNSPNNDLPWDSGEMVVLFSLNKNNQPCNHFHASTTEADDIKVLHFMGWRIDSDPLIMKLINKPNNHADAIRLLVNKHKDSH